MVRLRIVNVNVPLMDFLEPFAFSLQIQRKQKSEEDRDKEYYRYVFGFVRLFLRENSEESYYHIDGNNPEMCHRTENNILLPDKCFAGFFCLGKDDSYCFFEWCRFVPDFDEFYAAFFGGFAVFLLKPKLGVGEQLFFV